MAKTSAAKPQVENCRRSHPDGDTTCTRKKGHRGTHSGPFGEGMTLEWTDGAKPTADENCARTIAGNRCLKEAGHPDNHIGKDQHGNEVEWVDGASDAAKLATDVDGKKAEVVLNGTTGAPVEQRLINDDITDLEKQIARAHAVFAQKDEEKKAASKAASTAQDNLNELVGELVRRINGEQPLPFNRPPQTVNGQPANDPPPPELSDEALERIANVALAEESEVTAGVKTRDLSGAE